MVLTAEDLLRDIEQAFPAERLYRYAKILNRQYHLSHTDDQIWDALISIFGNKYLFDKYKNCIVANEIVNAILMRYYSGERIIKYHFIKSIINKGQEVKLFEMYADRSRVDLGRINGKSIAYEIKTDVDTLTRLDKQIADYAKLFELVYVIVDRKHLQYALDLPSYCGVISYRLSDGVCKFSPKRRAIVSPLLDPSFQARSMSSEEIHGLLKQEGVHPIPKTKNRRIEILLRTLSPKKINSAFKSVVRAKYEGRWLFIVEHFAEIYPIDLQSFFHSPLDPKLVYYKSSGCSDKV